MMTSAQTTAAQFANAVDFFFGHNPANPYWALVALTMRKKGELEIVYTLDKLNDFVLDAGAPFHGMDDAAPEPHIVCHTTKPERIRDIMDIFRANEIHSITSSVLAGNQWERSFLLSFAHDLINLDEEWLQANFEKCFTTIVRRAFAKSRIDDYSQPTQLTELVGGIITMISPDARLVYNPFSGLSSYALHMPKNAKYIGEELFGLIGGIAELRIYAHGIEGEIKYDDANHCETYGADLLVATPPFGWKVPNNPMATALMEFRRDCASNLLYKCIEHLIPGIVIVPSAFNSRSSYDFEARKDFIESGMLDMVITLPENIFDMTAISTTIYVVNPCHNHPGYVKVVDASKCFTGEKRKNLLLPEKVLDVIRSHSKFSKLVSTDELFHNNCVLTPQRYLSADIVVPEGMKLMKVSDLGFIFKQRAEGLTYGRLVNFGVLANPNILKVFKSSDFEEGELPQRALNLVHSGLLIFGSRKNMGICISSEGQTPESMLVTHLDYINFIPDDEIILPQYLLMQMQEEYVQAQLTENHVARLNRDTFENLHLLVPSLEEQRKAIEEYQSRIIVELGFEVDALRTLRADEQKHELENRKHRIGQILGDVCPALNNIVAFVTKTASPISADTIVDELFHSSLIEELNSIQQGLKKVQGLMRHLTEDLEFPHPDDIDFCGFIATNAVELAGHRRDVAWRGEFLEDENPRVKFPTDSLKIIFENIFSNARKYGFVGNRDDYTIRVDYKCVQSSETTMLQIIVANNGVKLTKGINPQDVFKWGKTSGKGEGIGGWQMKNLVEHYGGNITFEELSDNPEGFTVQYVINLPVIDQIHE